MVITVTIRKKRDLQLEAKAHITVQKWIDEGGLIEPPTSATSIIEIHQRFCELLPPDLELGGDPKQRNFGLPGHLRERYVQVGRHIPPALVPCPVLWSACKAYAECRSYSGDSRGSLRPSSPALGHPF